LFTVGVVGAWAWLALAHSGSHGAVGLLRLVATWGLMTLAMMAPTAVPVLSSLLDVLRGRAGARWWGFLGGYLAVWAVFAVVVALVQWWLLGLGLVDRHGQAVPRVSAAVLVAAGAYQFSSVKQRCLTECVSPMTFFLRHWREGTVGALRMGVRHGATCVGCCWALMLLGFVGGLATWWFMPLATALMVLEKLPGVGRRLTVPLGSALLVAGVLTLLFVDAGGHGHAAASAVVLIGKEVPWTSGRSRES
jgi:predicted metal-binding membrane protein